MQRTTQFVHELTPMSPQIEQEGSSAAGPGTNRRFRGAQPAVWNIFDRAQVAMEQSLIDSLEGVAVLSVN